MKAEKNVSSGKTVGSADKILKKCSRGHAKKDQCVDLFLYKIPST